MGNIKKRLPPAQKGAMSSTAPLTIVRMDDDATVKSDKLILAKRRHALKTKKAEADEQPVVLGWGSPAR